MQRGYLDINRRKYNDLTIALGLALNQLGNKNLKESFEKIKDEIRYDGDHSAENNVYKSISLKANYERALNKKIDLELKSLTAGDAIKNLAKKNKLNYDSIEIKSKEIMKFDFPNQQGTIHLPLDRLSKI